MVQSAKERAMMAQIKKNIERNKKLSGKLKITYTVHGKDITPEGISKPREPDTIVIHNADLTDVAKLQNQFKNLKQGLLLKIENEDEKHKARMVFEQ